MKSEIETHNGKPVLMVVYEAALKLRDRGAELLVMDCIGFTWEMKRRVLKETGLPVVLPRTVAARTLAELFG